MRNLAVVVVGLAFVACGGSSSSLPGGGTDDGGAPPDDDGGGSAEASAPVDASQDVVTPPPPADSGVDSGPKVSVVPTCMKANFSDALCAMDHQSLPYGCTNDLNAASCVADGTNFCCPNPPAPGPCSANDPFCVSQGSASRGLTTSCQEPEQGCEIWMLDGNPIYCCKPGATPY